MDGFELIPEVISEGAERKLVERIKKALDGIPESGHGKAERSRVIRYGFNYAAKKPKWHDIPDWLAVAVAVLLIRFDFKVNSITINEYKPGHGITPHIDASYFGPVIAIFSLGGSATMMLTPPDPGRTESPLPPQFIPPRSLVILSGEARKTWKHAIEGKSVVETRYSIVFRERLLK